jgi:hypothetical protein
LHVEIEKGKKAGEKRREYKKGRKKGDCKLTVNDPIATL